MNFCLVDKLLQQPQQNSRLLCHFTPKPPFIWLHKVTSSHRLPGVVLRHFCQNWKISLRTLMLSSVDEGNLWKTLSVEDWWRGSGAADSDQLWPLTLSFQRHERRTQRRSELSLRCQSIICPNVENLCFYGVKKIGFFMRHKNRPEGPECYTEKEKQSAGRYWPCLLHQLCVCTIVSEFVHPIRLCHCLFL